MAAKYKLIIFDVDGTLLDTKKGICSSVQYAVAKCGLPVMPSEEIERIFIGPPILKTFKKTYALNDEEAKQAEAFFRERYLKFDLFRAEVYDGIYDLLKFMRNAKLNVAIATYKRNDCALKLLEHFGFLEFTQNIHGADFEGKMEKKDLISQCIKDSECSNLSHIIMVGDSENDAFGAFNAGIAFLGVTYGYGFRKGGNYDYPMVGSPYEIISFLST